MSKSRLWLCFLFLLSLPCSQKASAAIVGTPALEIKTGETVQVPVAVDQAEGLAGIKIVLRYDSALLRFVGAEKTPASASLMHVVNDKKPGRLVIVMAGAKGINGRNVKLIVLEFKAQPDLQNRKVAAFQVDEIQLMSDQLKEIPGQAQFEPIAIVP